MSLTACKDSQREQTRVAGSVGGRLRVFASSEREWSDDPAVACAVMAAEIVETVQRKLDSGVCFGDCLPASGSRKDICTQPGPINLSCIGGLRLHDVKKLFEVSRGRY
jgi:hypothetical protein